MVLSLFKLFTHTHTHKHTHTTPMAATTSTDTSFESTELHDLHGRFELLYPASLLERVIFFQTCSPIASAPAARHTFPDPCVQPDGKTAGNRSALCSDFLPLAFTILPQKLAPAGYVSLPVLVWRYTTPDLNEMQFDSLCTCVNVHPCAFSHRSLARYHNHFVGKGHLGYETMDHLPINRGFLSHVGYLSGGEEYATYPFICLRVMLSSTPALHLD